MRRAIGEVLRFFWFWGYGKWRGHLWGRMYGGEPRKCIAVHGVRMLPGKCTTVWFWRRVDGKERLL